jgi:hypothetical protein
VVSKVCSGLHRLSETPSVVADLGEHLGTHKVPNTSGIVSSMFKSHSPAGAGQLDTHSRHTETHTLS